MKNTFKDNQGNFHFGINASDEFSKIDKQEIINALKNIGDKKLWRCNVCNDLHIGIEPPKQCPTCMVVDAYVEINEKEFLEIIKW